MRNRRTRPIGFHLRTRSQISVIQEKWDVWQTTDPSVICKTVMGRLRKVATDHIVRVSKPTDLSEQEFRLKLRRELRWVKNRLKGATGRAALEDYADYYTLPPSPSKQHSAPANASRFSGFVSYSDVQFHELEVVKGTLWDDLQSVMLDTDTTLKRPNITPRRVFPPPLIEDDPFRPKVPGPLPTLDNWSVLGSVHLHMEFWFRTLFWLKGLLSMIEESIDKGHDDLIVLDSGPEVVGEGVYERLYWRRREVVPTTEEVHMFTCSCDPRFYGPEYIPDVEGIPSYEDVETLVSFKRSHRREKLKFFEHLYFLYEVIEEELVPQVEAKLESLVNREHRWLDDNNQEPATAEYTDHKDLFFADADTCRKDLATRLRSRNWLSLCDAIYDVRVLSKYHKESLLEILEDVIPLVGDLVNDSRPVVSKSAIMACEDMHAVYGDIIINDHLLNALFRKSTGLHKFISEVADKFLINMVDRIPPILLLSNLLPLTTGRSFSVQAKARQFFRLCMSILGNEGIVAYALYMKNRKAGLGTGSAKRLRHTAPLKKPWQKS